jgi:hypothetical protein
MAIYEPKTTASGYKRFENIPGAYYCCGWITGTTEVIKITTQSEPIIPPTYPSGPLALEGFAMDASDGFTAFLDEIDNRGLTVDPALLVEDDA